VCRYDREQSTAELEDKTIRPNCPNNYDPLPPGAPADSHKGWMWLSVVLPSVEMEVTAFKMATDTNNTFDEVGRRGSITFPVAWSDNPDFPASVHLSPEQFNFETLEFEDGYVSPFQSGLKQYPTKTHLTVSVRPTSSLFVTSLFTH